MFCWSDFYCIFIFKQVVIKWNITVWETHNSLKISDKAAQKNIEIVLPFVFDNKLVYSYLSELNLNYWAQICYDVRL